MARDTSESVTPRLPSIFNAPYEEDPDFLHRAGVAKDVQQAAADNKPIVLCGKSGTGKSHLALQLAYDFCKEARANKHEDAFVLWIHAKSNHSILSSFNTIALQAGLPVIEEPGVTPCQMVADWLEDEFARHAQTTLSTVTTTSETASSPFSNRRYLIVVDGLESFDLWNKRVKLESKFEKYDKPVHKHEKLRKYLHHKNELGGNLIITTPHEEIAAHFDTKPITLGNLSPEEAQTMCGRILGEDVPPSLGATLSKRLSTNPLMVHLSAARLQYSGISIEDYVDDVLDAQQSLNNRDPPADYLPVFREEVSEPHKANLLLAVLATHLQYLWKNDSHFEKDEIDTMSTYVRFASAVARGGWHVPLSKSSISAYDDASDDGLAALRTLSGLGLIRRIRAGFYTVAHVIQMAYWMCGRIQSAAMKDSQTDIATVFVAKYEKGRGQAHMSLPMTETVLCHPEKNLEGMFYLLDQRAHYYLSVQFYQEAWRDANSAYDVCQEIQGDNVVSESMITALRGLGHVSHNMGKYKLALKLEKLALDCAEKLPATDELRIMLIRDYCTSLSSTCRYDEAITILSKTIAELEPNNTTFSALLQCKSILSNCLSNVGDVDKAFELAEANLAKLTELYGEECHEARAALGTVVSLLWKQNRLEEALVKARHWVKLSEKTEGPDALKTLWASMRLGSIMYDAGDKVEAYRLFKRAKDGYVEKVGPNHPTVQSMEAEIEQRFKNTFVGV